MKTALALSLTAAALLAACNQSSMPAAASGVPLHAAANGQSMMLGNESYTITEAKSYPLIDQWTYSAPTESLKKWTKRIQVQRYKKVNADEIYEQMLGATPTHLAESDTKTKTICYVTEREDGKAKEAYIWKYQDIRTADGKFTYANGISWQFPAGTAFNTFMKGEFPNTCESMRTLTLVTMPPIAE